MLRVGVVKVGEQPKKTGFISISNGLWDEIIRRDFSKRQKDILLFILRLSYGCRKKEALIPKLKDFSLCGVQPNHIKAELDNLDRANVIRWDRDSNHFEMILHYDSWCIEPVKSWDDDQFKHLVHINIQDYHKTRREDDSDSAFPKQEVYEEDELPEMGSFENDDFPKREVFLEGTSQNGKLELPEMGSETYLNPLLDMGYSVSTDSITDNKKITDSLNNTNSALMDKYFEEFWLFYPKRVGKKDAQRHFKRLWKEKDFSIDEFVTGTKNYVKFCTKINRILKDGSSFVNQETYKEFLDPMEVPETKTSTGSRYERNMELLQQAMKEALYEEGGDGTHIENDLFSLPELRGN